MDKVYPFSTFGRAMAFYRFRNPARQKFTNIHEKDRGGYDEDFSGIGGQMIFAALANAIARVMRQKSKTIGDSFMMWYVTLRDTDRGRDFIAEHLNIPERQVRKNIEECEDEIAQILISKEILDPLYEDNARYAREIRKQQDKPN